jgi:hypothetical protein
MHTIASRTLAGIEITQENFIPWLVVVLQSQNESHAPECSVA